MGLVRGMGTRAGGSRDGGTDRGEGGTRGGRFCPNDALARRVDRRARGSEGETPNAGSRGEAREDAPDARRIETFGWTAPVPRDDASPPPHHRRPESRRREPGESSRAAPPRTRRREAPSSSRKTSLASVKMCVRRGVARAPICPRRAPRPGALSASHHGEIRSFYVRPTASKFRPPRRCASLWSSATRLYSDDAYRAAPLYIPPFTDTPRDTPTIRTSSPPHPPPRSRSRPHLHPSPPRVSIPPSPTRYPGAYSRDPL